MSVETMKVLICDDSILARKKTKTALNQLGVTQIFEAADGEQAIAAYKEHLPDITLMDIVMPKVDGVAALKAILEVNPKAKVVMASSVGIRFSPEAYFRGADQDSYQQGCKINKCRIKSERNE